MIDNPKDPLRQSPDNTRELFVQFGHIANGFSSADAIGAALNIVINALRQSNSSRVKAERAFDELFGRAKQALLDHYDALGRKRGIFAYDQVISVPQIDLRTVVKDHIS